MDSNEILARFGISEKLAYGLFIQSILVIIATIISGYESYRLYTTVGFTFKFIVSCIAFLVCISLLTYSFYGFNSKNNQETYFTAAIILYIIQKFYGIWSFSINHHNPLSILKVITFLAAIYFLYAHIRNYKSAQYTMLLIIILELISAIYNVFLGMPWYVILQLVIVPCAIALTHFERVQRGKYPSIK